MTWTDAFDKPAAATRGCRPVGLSWRLPRGIALLLLATAATGCDSSPYELAPVTGSVTIDGQPLPAGRVMFAPIAKERGSDPGKPAFGTVQPDGSFTLTTYDDGDGAIVGDHWVTVIGPSSDEESGDLKNVPKFGKFVVRQKQSVVAGRENQHDLALTSDEIARFASD